MGVDSTDNELLTLEIIHHFVEVLDRYFGNVCELDLIFNFHKVRLNAVLLPQGCEGLWSSAVRSASRVEPGVRRSVRLLLCCTAPGGELAYMVFGIAFKVGPLSNTYQMLLSVLLEHQAAHYCKRL